MRITIETEERGREEIPARTPTEPGRVEAMDAGAPPESLTQLTTAGVPAAGGEGTNAGSPPAWLMEAIEGATLPVEAASGDMSAGAAPDMTM